MSGDVQEFKFTITVRERAVQDRKRVKTSLAQIMTKFAKLQFHDATVTYGGKEIPFTDLDHAIGVVPD